MASGDIMCVVFASSYHPTASNAASPDIRNGRFVLDFDAATDEEAVFDIYLLPSYSGGGLTCTAGCYASTATSGNFVLQMAIERGNTDIDADSFAAFQSSGAVATNATSGIVTLAPVAFTNGAQMDNLAAGEAGRLKIRRDADDTSATDSMAGDLEFDYVIVKET